MVRAWSETQTGNRVKGLDADGAYNTHDFKTWASQQGVDLRISMTDSPGQNGLPEVHGGTVVQMTRAMMLESGAPKTFWPWAAQTAYYLKNRIVCRSATGEERTPFEAFHNRKPDVSDLRVWGCTVYAKIVPERLKAGTLTEPNAVECMFVGYADRVQGVLQHDVHKRKGWLVYDQRTQRVYSTRNARFEESNFPTITKLPTPNRTVKHNVGGSAGGASAPAVDGKQDDGQEKEKEREEKGGVQDNGQGKEKEGEEKGGEAGTGAGG